MPPQASVAAPTVSQRSESCCGGSRFTSNMPHLAAHAKDLQLACRQLEAANTQLKVRHVAAIAPLLWRQLRCREGHLLQSAFGSWQYSTASHAATQSVEHLEDAASQKVWRQSQQRRLGILQAVDHTTQVAFTSAVSRVAAAVFALWRLQIASVNRLHHTSIQTLVGLGVGPAWKEALIMSSFCDWQRNCACARSDRLRQYAKNQRWPLLHTLCEAKSEATGLRCQVQLAQAHSRVLHEYANKGLSTLQLINGEAVSDAFSEDITPSNLEDMCHPPDDTWAERATVLHAWHHQALVSLTEAHHRLASCLAAESTSGDTNIQLQARGDRGSSAHEMCAELRHLRLECMRLIQEVGLTQQHCAAQAADIQHEGARQLQQERQRTQEFEDNLSQAREWVAGLKAKHKSLALSQNCAAGSMAGKSGSASALHGELPQVQRALCALAEVSEELLTTA